jgi:pantoate--beta-alanine ligase
VLKLFNLAQPTRAYFGLKDYQQTLIIRKFVKDLDIPVDIVLCPTVREPDGLAVSSRNSYLSPYERQAAAVLYRALSQGERSIKKGERNAGAVSGAMRDLLSGAPEVAQIEYAGVYDPETLEDLDEIREPVLLALAVKIGRTRLIDNLLLNQLQ